MSEQPNISLVTILHDNKEFYPLFQYHWETFDYPKDKLEWIKLSSLPRKKHLFRPWYKRFIPRIIHLLK